MKKLYIIFILIANQVFAEDDNTLELSTQIDQVTVFLKGAQITRNGKIQMKPGRKTLIMKNLSPYIESKSIQVKGTGEFTILSVNHSFNYLDELTNDQKVDSLIKITQNLESEIMVHKYREVVLSEKLSLLNVNKKMGNELSHVTVDDLKNAIEFYDKTLMDIKTEEMELKNKIHQLNTQLSKIKNQIKELQNNTGEPTGEICISVDADRQTIADLTINYIVANAGWFPKYDLRVKDVENPLQLTYKAEVYQNTGKDWENVRLKFSNGNPNQSGVAPKLNVWHLNYFRNIRYKRIINNLTSVVNSNIKTVSGRVIDEEQSPLPGVNVIVKGSSIGTVTDLKGFYSITLPNEASELIFSSVGYESAEIPISSSNININLTPAITELSEVLVTAYGVSSRNRFNSPLPKNDQEHLEAKTTVITTTVENQTTVEFEVEKPYSLKSNGKNLMVNLNTYEIETLYEYYGVPKLDKDAFLIARIINWDQFHLLEGEANLYFEDAYVGRSVLDAKTMSDTLDISLGRDHNIIIGREKIDSFTRHNSFGTNKVESRGFNIIARNKKSHPIQLTILDQIPVSVISPIEVNAKELSGGLLDENTGEVSWTIEILPNNQTELELRYEVKYPKSEKVILE